MNKKKLTKAIIFAACAMLLVVGTVIGTVAYLTAKTETKTNTFTFGDINITLKESSSTNSKIVPGVDLDENPNVTVVKNSEECWLFVKLDEQNSFEDFLTYTIADNWTELTAGSGVYYRLVAFNETTDQTFDILKGNKVTAKTDITKESFKTLTEATYPKLAITAYAVQKAGFADAAAAWVEAKKLG